MAIFHNSNFIDANTITMSGSYENLHYCPYNFEVFSSSMVTLYNLMIVNNRHIIINGYVRDTTQAVTIFLVIFKRLGFKQSLLKQLKKLLAILASIKIQSLWSKLEWY